MRALSLRHSLDVPLFRRVVLHKMAYPTVVGLYIALYPAVTRY